MTAEHKPETSLVCLLDIPWSVLSVALSNPETAKLITDYNESGVIAKIDELANLVEVPTEVYFLDTKAVEETRQEWTVEMPTAIYQKIMSFSL